MSAPAITVSAQARASFLTLFSIRRSFSTAPAKQNGGQFHRSDFTNQGFTGFYEAGGPTAGPLGDASAYGAPRITPKRLKEHLDQFVVGQERAKKILSVAVYNHYQRVQELQRRQDEEEALLAQRARQELRRHPVEGRHPASSSSRYDSVDNEVETDEFPGQQHTVNMNAPPPPPLPRTQSRIGTQPIIDDSPLSIEKSNVLLLGPSGVGKTLMAKTLARILEVPFSMSDCTPFTQAGYIGEDAEVCVQRLLAAANYDVARAERGIICLDEIDKIATAKVSHGKDVSGEGVQQALLKIIEGTTVQVQAKQERGSGPGSGGTRNQNAIPTGGVPHNNVLGGGNAGAGAPQPTKGETYNVQTDNILFICTGAFNGLHKHIMDRVSKGSIGFGAPVRGAPSSATQDSNDPTIKANSSEEELFKKHLPFYDSPAPLSTNHTSSAFTSDTSSAMLEDYSDPFDPPEPTYNTLDLAIPSDLHRYGMIPELTGRLPITCAVSPLSLPLLTRVLTEPRNSLLSQYTQLLALSGIELRFTTPALREVARAAAGTGTGARGLRTVMERLLADAMFEAPGSGIRHVLVTEAVARREQRVLMFGRGAQGRFYGLIAEEEEQWEQRKRRRRRELEGKAPDDDGGGAAQVSTFEQYRERVKVAGSG